MTHAQIAHTRSASLASRGDLVGAEVIYRRALATSPNDLNLRSALGAILLAQGQLDEGFPLFDAAKEILTPQGLSERLEFPFPRWRGEPLAGKKLLITSEEGLGDQIMYARFAKVLQNQGAGIEWLCTPALARLFRECLGIVAIPGEGTVELDAYDFHCPSSALPLAFGLTLENLPSAPYLARPQSSGRSGFRFGVATHGNPNQPNDKARSLPLSLAAKLLALPGAVSLHPEETGARDLYDTAAIMSDLDLVVSVCTAPAHLAGALGMPVWVLLMADHPDWRWMRDRVDSPWYPSATLYRQNRPGRWRNVVDRLKADLELRRLALDSNSSLIDDDLARRTTDSSSRI